MAVHELEGYQEVMQKLLDKLSPEDRMAGLAPEERVAGLTPEQVLLTLPDAVLRALSEEYIATLPEPTRTTIRARRGR